MTPTKHPLRRWRRDRRKTLAELSKRANVSVAYLSEIERGATEPGFAIIKRLSRITRIPVAQFVEFVP